MKTYSLLAVLCASGILCGCGSIVTSTKETALPKTSEPLTGIRYYLPRGRVQVSAAWDKIIPGWQPKICPLIEADPGACYRIERNVNAFFDDDITIQVDPMTGLLQSASATSTDQSVAALASLAAAMASPLTFGANLGVPAGAAATRGPLTAEEREKELREFAEVTNNAVSSSFSVIVDPRHPTQTYYLVEPDDASRGEHNSKLYAKYVIELRRNGDEPLRASGTESTRTNLSGIVVRTPISHTMTVTGTFYKEATHPVPQQPTTQIVFLPDEDHDYFIPLTRIPLVTSSTTVSFVNGMVHAVQRSRPSMVNAIAGIPKNILSALVPLPSGSKQSNVQVVGHANGDKTGTGSSHP